MGRLIGYVANRGDLLVDALAAERETLGLPSTDTPTGWGVGFYQGGEVLHRKRPLLEGAEFSWEAIARGVQSDCAIVHVRNATVGDFRAENTHPFRLRSWLGAHMGTVERFESIRGPLAESIPDFLRRNIRGGTDSEHVFHLFLAFLHDRGQLDTPDVDTNHVLAALRSTVTLVDQLSREVSSGPAGLNLVLTNGRTMYALCRGLTMTVTERSGVVDRESIPGSGPRSRDRNAVDPRYVMIQSAETGGAGHQTLEDGTVAVVDRNLTLTLESL